MTGSPVEAGDPTTAVVTRAPARDGFGDPDPTAPAPRSHTISGCLLAPGETGESQDRADTVDSTWALYAPVGADILATDRVTIAGITGEVVGDPKRWPGAGVVVALRRVTG